MTFQSLFPLGSETHCVIVLCILYHVSMDEKSRGVFAYTDCIPQVSVCAGVSEGVKRARGDGGVLELS